MYYAQYHASTSSLVNEWNRYQYHFMLLRNVNNLDLYTTRDFITARNSAFLYYYFHLRAQVDNYQRENSLTPLADGTPLFSKGIVQDITLKVFRYLELQLWNDTMVKRVRERIATTFQDMTYIPHDSPLANPSTKVGASSSSSSALDK